MKSINRRCSTALFSLFLICQPVSVVQQSGFSLPSLDALPSDFAALLSGETVPQDEALGLPSPVSLNSLGKALSQSRYISQSA